jgi:hypothetical protein
MSESQSVWAIIYIEASDGAYDRDEWNLGSALFSSEDKAEGYARALNEADDFYVHDVIELEVF